MNASATRKTAVNSSRLSRTTRLDVAAGSTDPTPGRSNSSRSTSSVVCPAAGTTNSSLARWSAPNVGRSERST